MEPLERAAKLRQEADFIMQQVRLHDIMRCYGTVVPTGSYFLDTMVYPDVDLQIGKVSIEQLFDIGGQLAKCDMVTYVEFEKSNDPRLPGGLYLMPRIIYGEWGRPWKIDIWSLDDNAAEQQMQPMRHFKAQMTARLREQIIRYKFSIMTKSNRPPKGSGFLIYKAFIDEGLTDFHQVTEYLVANGIQMEAG